MTNVAEIFAPPTSTNLTPVYKNTSSEDIMGKEDFLTLLVAQLQNQDPLNPDDATEFTSQLAEFSSLEQLQNLNKSMDTLANTQQQSDRFATMDLIGKEVVYASSGFDFSGEPVNLGYQLDGTAASVTMHIRDENGNTVATLNPSEMREGNHFLEWDGLDKDGNIIPDGKYKLVLEASSAGEGSTIAASPLVQSEVTGVDFSSETGEAVIRTLAGAEISSSAIIAVYQADKSYTKEIATDDEDTIVDEIVDDIVDDITADVTGTSTSPTTEESASTDEEQIAQDTLQHYLAG
ncbi:flagellar hook capping protein [Desulfocapsa sulfexigens DSM 10523]|uniref:Basal-body rod modification protein FlgD n=1 Tax=Desulfocapsa sulfexigens (strain DSM 10523 / SB164P1) TaxID=1167006 RepID=M1NJ81_DESSD|nr:flagellar hook assembly protein FlgD [Desulfocapsa sulfexigens]AGF79609.1 flagellar hook capping protein [Desulfocapsa sulfexigens DSM 10523]